MDGTNEQIYKQVPGFSSRQRLRQINSKQEQYASTTRRVQLAFSFPLQVSKSTTFHCFDFKVKP